MSTITPGSAPLAGLFANPEGAGDRIQDFGNKRVLIRPVECFAEKRTKYTKPGEQGNPAVRAEWVDLEDATMTVHSGIVYPRFIVQSLINIYTRNGVAPTIGTIVSDPSKQKDGNNTPWVLDSALLNEEAWVNHAMTIAARLGWVGA